MDFKAELQEIIRYLQEGDYTAVALRTRAIEQAFKYTLKRELPKLTLDEQQKVYDAVQRRGKRRTIDTLTLGDLAYVLRESKFLEAWMRMSGKHSSRAQWLNLEGFAKFRNEVHHDIRNVTKSEAETWFANLRGILEEFELVSLEEIERMLATAKTQAQKKASTPQISYNLKAPERVKISPDDYRELRQFLQNVPGFQFSDTRYALLQGAFAGWPNAEKIISQVYYERSASTTTINLLELLQNFGTLKEGKPALGVFLEHLKSLVGEDGIRFIDNFFRKCPSLNPNVQPETDFQWMANALTQLYFPGTQRGMGFLVAPVVLITTHHLLPSLQHVQQAEFRFNGPEGNILIPHLPIQDFYTNSQLDYSLLQFAELPVGEVKCVRLAQTRVHKDDRIALLQSVSDNTTQLSLQYDVIVSADESFISYRPETDPGMAGSPILNDAADAIAIQQTQRNSGTSTNAILRDVQQNASRLYKYIAA
jgi:hypothetical protein